jgi:hypothetical protein
MHAFIVRPFGIKNDVDFEAVERDLIDPALHRLNITGRTTSELVGAGSIRADMFHLLLTADVVIADVSIHNANVFYELGVRHSLRDKRTFMIRASMDEIPFDLKTDRYLTYEAKQPSLALDRLIAGLAATIRESVVDSPVYSLVPGLEPPDPASFIVVPRDFQEEVDVAKAERDGGDLRFLASELVGLSWKREGRRVIGEAQFELKDLGYAAETWETIREEVPDDVQANLRLGTIYQKLGDLVHSDLALRRVVAVKNVSASNLAESRALLGSNIKSQWLNEWMNRESEDRQVEALRSPRLMDALEEYRKGFEAEPRHYYSGLNALALATVATELAAVRPDVWNERFNDQDEARFRLKSYAQLRSQLAGAVEFSLIAQEQRLARERKSDPWLKMSFADLAFLTCRANVQQQYREAVGLLGPFGAASALRQVEMFKQLGILSTSVAASTPMFQGQAQPASPSTQPLVILFTGHRVDAPGRAKPRFPVSGEPIARDAIRNAVQRAAGGSAATAIAISGCASGGDLLFLEVCEELGIARHMYLIIPRDEYVRESVAPAGANWVGRFNRQFDSARCRVYQKHSSTLPGWLQSKPNYSVWERSNAWMLYNALWRGRTTLIALWDGKEGDGPGGTRHMVDTAAGRGAMTVIVNTKELFGI